MCNPIPYFNGLLTVTENIFNVVGYLPKQHFPKIHQWGVMWRRNQGIAQLITGLALIALGYLASLLIPSLAIATYLSLPLQVVSFGLLLANHGAFNLLRSGIEKIHLPGLTLVYDFYGKKILPALNPDYDVLNLVFLKIKNLMNRLVFISLFPPQCILT